MRNWVEGGADELVDQSEWIKLVEERDIPGFCSIKGLEESMVV